MARMRHVKSEIRQKLAKIDWRNYLEEIATLGATAIGPLFSFLLLDPLMMHRAAVALGATCAFLSHTEMEKARNVVRRYMWHLSEESGNIGWGIPEAFAETMVMSPRLAHEFSKLLISYVIDLGKADNYCDNPILRRSCYWACGRFAKENPETCLSWKPWLAKGLEDEDEICRGMACFALSAWPLDLMLMPKVRELALKDNSAICLLFDGENIREQRVSSLALALLERAK